VVKYLALFYYVVQMVLIDLFVCPQAFTLRCDGEKWGVSFGAKDSRLSEQAGEAIMSS